MVKHYYKSFRKEFIITSGIHSASSIMILLEGEYEYFDGEQTKTIQPFTPVIYKKGTPFKRHVTKHIRYLLVTLTQLPNDIGTFLEFSENDSIRLKSTIEHLVEAVVNDIGIDVIEHFVKDILLTAKNSNELPKNDIPAVVSYIRDHFCEKIALETLAEVGCCSKQTLIKKFKKHYSITPIEYINRLKISKAKELLTNTTEPIKNIAEQCGFDNLYYFSNTFKKHVKISPLAFRQKSMI